MKSCHFPRVSVHSPAPGPCVRHSPTSETGRSFSRSSTSGGQRTSGGTRDEGRRGSNVSSRNGSPENRPVTGCSSQETFRYSFSSSLLSPSSYSSFRSWNGSLGDTASPTWSSSSVFFWGHLVDTGSTVFSGGSNGRSRGFPPSSCHGSSSGTGEGCHLMVLVLTFRTGPLGVHGVAEGSFPSPRPHPSTRVLRGSSSGSTCRL